MATHDPAELRGDLSWFPDFHQPAGCHFGCMNVSRRCATDVHSVFTSGPGYDKATTCSEIPLQLLPYYQSASRRDPDVLSPQACPDTCWRDQLLASTCNNQSPRVRRYPENWPILLVNISGINPDEIPPIWPLPLFPALFPPFIQSARYLCISFSWLVSFYSMNMFCFCFFPLQFCLSPGLFVAVASWDLCMRSTQILRVHQGQCQGLNVTQLFEIWAWTLCLQVRISVCNHVDLTGAADWW